MKRFMTLIAAASVGICLVIGTMAAAGEDAVTTGAEDVTTVGADEVITVGVEDPMDGGDVITVGTEETSAGEDVIMPGAIVDFTTQKGFDRFDALAAEFDLINLNTGEYSIHGTNGKVEWEFVTEDGESFTRFKPVEPLPADGIDPATGKRDPNEGDFRMTAEIEFAADEYEYISFCYRAPKKAHFSPNNIYIRDDSHSGEFEGTPGMWTASNMKASGEWILRNIKVKSSFTAVSGNVKSIRIPIPGRTGEYFDVKYIAVFKDKASADNFDLAKYNEALARTEADATEPPAENATEGQADPGETEAPSTNDEPSVTGSSSADGSSTDDSSTDAPSGPKETNAAKKGCGSAALPVFTVLIPAGCALLMVRRKQ